MRKPYFFSGMSGMCVQYPVSVHIDGRKWEDKWILVPLRAWRDGVRTFGFVDCVGQYTVSGKVEKSVAKAVMDCYVYIKKLEEYHRMQEELQEMRESIENMGEHYTGVKVW